MDCYLYREHQRPRVLCGYDFSFDEWNDLDFYEPYNSFYPCKQTKLLRLWDHLGVPHSKLKQLYGLQLVIIGFDVDPNAMTATMPKDSKADLVLALRHFASSQSTQLAGISANSGVVELVLQRVPLDETWTLQHIRKDARKDEPFRWHCSQQRCQGRLELARGSH